MARMVASPFGVEDLAKAAIEAGISGGDGFSRILATRLIDREAKPGRLMPSNGHWQWVGDDEPRTSFRNHPLSLQRSVRIDSVVPVEQLHRVATWTEV